MKFEINEELIRKFFPYEVIRDQQFEAIVKTLEAFSEGYRHVFLEAPTGVGKSAVGLTVARYMNHIISTVETPHKTCMATITKYLQGQYRRDFPFLNDIRNAMDPKYTCNVGENKGTEGCIINRKKTDDQCVKSCPYRHALMAFRAGPISITNAHFFALAPFRFNLGILDECHELASVIASQAELKMQAIDVSKLSLIFRGDTDEVMDAWGKVARFVATIDKNEVFDFMDTRHLLDIDMETYQERVEILAGEKDFRPVQKEWNKFKNNVGKALLVSEAKMVKVIEEDDFTGQEQIFVRPIYAREFAPDMLFTKSDRFLHMSATICGFEGYARELGLENQSWKGIEIAHAIPAERREVFFSPVSWMSAKNETADIQRTVAFVDDMIEKYDANTIIHSASYKRANEIARQSRHKIHVPKSASEALEYLGEATKEKHVASPSLIAGVDGKDDLCRLNIVAKVPYPSFGDPRIKYIAKHNPDMLNQGIIRSIVQASGRGTRHEEDWSHSYIIDGCFDRLLNDWPQFFPKWFMEALRR